MAENQRCRSLSFRLVLVYALLYIVGDMTHIQPKCRATIEEGLALLSSSGGRRFATLLEHGSLSVELYAPKGIDAQEPHTRDEVYIVARGSGSFLNGDERYAFGPGDLLFVPAGVIHCFEDFSDDLIVWVLFYGPEGGERT